MLWPPPPPSAGPLTRREYGWLAAIAVLFVLIAALAARTKAPANDEGPLANISWTLVQEGRMAITIYVDKDRPGEGVDKRAYLVAPLYPVVLAGVFEVWGRSLVAMRWIAIVFGVVGIGAFFLYLDRLTGRRPVALLGAGLLGLSYVYLDAGSYGRMDNMSTALGLAGWAAYLYWREEQFDRAILVSQTLIVLGGITHWCGLFWALGLYLQTIGWDGRRLRWRHLGLAAIPYGIAGAAWGAYIWLDPREFLRQFFGNAKASGRMSGLSAPWMGIWREFTERYPTSYGLGAHMAGNRGPIFLKAGMLAAYVAALVACLVWTPLRKREGRGMLLLLAALFFLLHGILEGQKLTLYLVHIVPMYTGLLALAAAEVAERGIGARWAVAVGLAGLLLVDAGGMLYRTRQNALATINAPVGAAIREQAPAGSLVYGHSSLYFTVDERYVYRDDSYLGYLDGKVPDYYITDLTWDIIHTEQKELQSNIWRHIAAVRERSQLLYRNAAYAVYRVEKR